MDLTAAVWKEGPVFVARCLELGVASQGTTKARAFANLREAVLLYLEDVPAHAKIPAAEIKRFRVAV